jgi:hypothetical protein
MHVCNIDARDNQSFNGLGCNSEPTEEMAAILVADLIIAREEKPLERLRRALTANYRERAVCSQKPPALPRKWKHPSWGP